MFTELIIGKKYRLKDKEALIQATKQYLGFGISEQVLDKIQNKIITIDGQLKDRTSIIEIPMPAYSAKEFPMMFFCPCDVVEEVHLYNIF